MAAVEQKEKRPGAETFLARPGRWRFCHWLPNRCADRVAYCFRVLHRMPHRLSDGFRGKLHRLRANTDDAGVRGCGARQDEQNKQRYFPHCCLPYIRIHDCKKRFARGECRRSQSRPRSYRFCVTSPSIPSNTEARSMTVARLLGISKAGAPSLRSSPKGAPSPSGFVIFQ